MINHFLKGTINQLFKKKMQNPIYKTIILLTLILIIKQGVKAQSNTLFFMDGIHQSNYLNPAYQNQCNGFLGLPGFSGLSIDVANTGFDYNDLIHNGQGILKDSLVIDIANIKAKLKNSNYLMAGTQIPIFGMGFWVKNAYFTFDISNKTRARISYPSDLVKLVDGNGNYIGENNPLEIKGVGPNLLNYNEIAFGLSKQITHRLTIGGKFKILSGNVSVESTNSNIKLYTQENTYAMRLETDLKLNISAPVAFEYDENGFIKGIKTDTVFGVSNLISAKNMGMVVDMGAVYQFNDKIKFYGSITDLGFIRWKNNAQNITQKGTFTFSGLSLDSVWTNSSYNEFQTVADSLANFFRFSQSYSKYNTYLNTNIFLGTTYDIGNFMNFGFLSKTYFFDKKIHEALTLSANFKPVKWFCGTLSYSYINREYRNIGLGIGIRTKGIQFYVLTDNLNVAFKPKDAKVARIQFGFNLYFGCGKRENLPMLKDKKPQKSLDFM